MQCITCSTSLQVPQWEENENLPSIVSIVVVASNVHGQRGTCMSDLVLPVNVHTHCSKGWSACTCTCWRKYCPQTDREERSPFPRQPPFFLPPSWRRSRGPAYLHPRPASCPPPPHTTSLLTTHKDTDLSLSLESHLAIFYAWRVGQWVWLLTPFAHAQWNRFRAWANNYTHLARWKDTLWSSNPIILVRLTSKERKTSLKMPCPNVCIQRFHCIDDKEGCKACTYYTPGRSGGMLIQEIC